MLPVVLGTLGGIGLLIGPIGLLAEKSKRDPALVDEGRAGMDVAFTVMLLLTGLTGLALLIWRDSAAMGPLLALHLGVVFALFVTMPYGKFVHGIYRYVALVRYARERRMGRLDLEYATATIEFGVLPRHRFALARSQIDHHVVAFHRHRERLRDVRSRHHTGARLDMDRIGLDPKPAGIAVGLAGADVELPAVPGAADDFAEPGVFDGAGIGRLRKSDQRPLAQRRALVRAAVQQAEELALDVEDRDRPFIDGEKLARARR